MEELEKTKKEMYDEEKKMKEKENTQEVGKKPWYGSKIFIGVLFVAGIFAAWQILSSKETEAPKKPSGEKAVVAPNPILAVQENDWVRGDKEAPVTIVEYLDFECEACGAYYPIIKQLEKEFEGKLKVVTRYFPLPGHKNSMEAALAVEAAGRQGKFFEMHDLLFESQKEWSEKPLSNPDLFLPYAEKLGLDMNKFNQDRKEAAVIARVDKNKKEADQLKLNGTPSFFLNGRAIKSPNTLEDFQSLIQKEIDALPVK
ncbi:MAG: DsbA family protein [Minisyncoccota bacterium]